MNAAEKIAQMRALPKEHLGVFLSNEECAWLLDAAGALSRLVTRLDIDTETMTVQLGQERVGYYPEEAGAIHGALAFLTGEEIPCSHCGTLMAWSSLSPDTGECAKCTMNAITQEADR